MSTVPDLEWRLAVLRGCSGLSRSGRAALADMARLCRLRAFEDGERVATRGAPVQGLEVVVKGAIRMASVAADGHENVYSLVTKGKVWGIVAALDGQGATHDAWAYSPTETLLLPRTALLALLARHPSLYPVVTGMLCHRLRKAHSLVDEFALAPLRQRLAHRLCTLAAAEAGGPGDDSARLRFTQADLAVMLSAARPTVNRELRRMRDEGLVDLGYRAVTVKRPAALRDICENREIYPY